MNESAKPRFAVDFDEIERQLAQTQAAPAQQHSAARNDPLAELARIVGQDDPFQSLLANDGSSRRRSQPAGHDDLFASHREAAPAPRARPTPVARPVQEAPAFDHDYSHQELRGAEPAGYGYQQAAPVHGGYDQGDYDQGYYDGQGQHGAPAYEPMEDYQPLEKPRSRKAAVIVGAVLGAVVIGGAGAYFLGGDSAGFGGDEPPLITASNEPVKVQPQNPGGVEIPNQNKQIYERASQTDTKVVNREEQPVDVEQAVRMNAGDATGATAPVQPGHGLNLGEPRKVRTVTVRPDGTIVQPDGAEAPTSSPIPTMALPEAAQAAAPAPQTAQAAPAQARPAAGTPAPAPAPVAAAPRPTAAPSTPAGGASPQQVASVQPSAVAPAPAAPEAAPTGGFAVQLGVSSSESQAQAALEQFQRKYAELQGLPPMIRRAEVNGNTIYRVRVGPMSREEASSLCSSLQGQGGQCFVAKN